MNNPNSNISGVCSLISLNLFFIHSPNLMSLSADAALISKNMNNCLEVVDVVVFIQSVKWERHGRAEEVHFRDVE